MVKKTRKYGTSKKSIWEERRAKGSTTDAFLHLELSESERRSYLHESVYKGLLDFSVHTSHLGTVRYIRCRS